MKTRYKVLGLLFVASIITYLDRVCLSVAGPSIQSDLGLRPDQWGWVVGSFVITYALCALPAAALGERYGTRKILALVVVWWSLFTFLTGAAANFKMLILTSLLFGMGEAGGYPNATGSLSRWFPKSERARAVSIVWTGARIGGALSSVKVPILRAYGWRVPFYLFAGIAVRLGWGFGTCVSGDDPAQKKRSDAIGD